MTSLFLLYGFLGLTYASLRRRDGLPGLEALLAGVLWPLELARSALDVLLAPVRAWGEEASGR
jgi:hypothetical protein